MVRTEGEQRCFNEYLDKLLPNQVARNVTPEIIAAEQDRIRAEGCMGAIQQIRLVRIKATGK